MKLTLEEIQEVLSKKVKDSSIVNSILKDLEKVVEDKKEELNEVKVPKLKNEFAVVLLDEAGKYKDVEMTGYIVKYKEGDDAGLILSRLSDSARAFNETKKGKKAPLTSMAEIFSYLKSKFIKASGVSKLAIMTKEPVRVIISSNKLT